MIRIMARKSYSDEFRRQAVDLYESTPDATLRGLKRQEISRVIPHYDLT